MIYYCLFLGIAFMAFYEQFEVAETRKKNITIVFYVTLAILFFLGTFRWERGTDWKAYHDFFICAWNSWDQHMEPGYVWLNRICRSLTDNYTVFLAVETGIYIMLLAALLKDINQEYREGRTFYFSILLYQYASNFAGIFLARSQIAIIICAHAVKDIKSRNIVGFLIKVLIAMLFHKSSLIMLLAYPIYHLKYGRKTYYILLGSATIGGVVLPSLLIKALSRFSFLSSYLIYTESNTQFKISFGLIKWVGVLLCLLLLQKYINNKGYDSLVRVFSVGVAIYCVGSIYSSVVLRLASSFFEILVFIIPVMLGNRIGRERAILLMFLVGFCFICFFTMLNGSYKSLYIPYKTIFDNVVVTTF